MERAPYQLHWGSFELLIPCLKDEILTRIAMFPLSTLNRSTQTRHEPENGYIMKTLLFCKKYSGEIELRAIND